MTCIVGIYCTDGVVIAADGAVTLVSPNGHTVEQAVRKIDLIKQRAVVIAGTGNGGLGQRFVRTAELGWNGGLSEQGKPVSAFKDATNSADICNGLARAALLEFTTTFLDPMHQAPLRPEYGALVAFPCGRNHYLYEFGFGNLQPTCYNENLWYVSMGSTQHITDAFLGFVRKVFWNDGPPSVSGGVFAAVWTLLHAVDVNPGGVDEPIMVATLRGREKGGGFEAKFLDDDELQQHRQNVDSAILHLRKYPNILQESSAGKDLPTPPTK